MTLNSGINFPPQSEHCENLSNKLHQVEESLRPSALVYRELERRIVFDGAMDATLAEVANVDASETPGHDEVRNETNELVEALGTYEADQAQTHEIVFIDHSVADIDKLIASIDPSFEVVLLQPDHDGVAQIADFMSGRSDVDAVHIISHGNQAELLLGTAKLNLDTINGMYSGQLESIGNALDEQADILIYGCNFGEGILGQVTSARLAQITGADVAASDDQTGHQTLGGDWDLEVQSGTIETDVVIDQNGQQEWQSILPTVNFQQGVSSYNGTQDTFVDDIESNVNKGNETEVELDVNGSGEGTAQGLIRFDNLFGNGPNQIPLGSTITSAQLTVDVFNDSDPSTQITLHRMLSNWSESSTWDSLTNGVQTNNVEASSTVDSTLANPGSTGPQTFTGLTATLQAWSNGDTNHGWVIITNSDNGWDFSSSEFATVAERPLLTVSFTPPPVNSAPVGLPVITGTTTEDQTLSADTSGISDADGLGAFSYQWYRDGLAISGVTSSTYTLGDADVGAQMNVLVSYTDGGGTAETVLSAATAAIANVNDAPVGLPVLLGSAVENQTLNLDISGVSDADGFSGAPGTFNIEWMSDGVVVATVPGPGAFVLGPGSVGTQISAAIVYVDGNGTTERIVSAATAPVVGLNNAPVGVPAITGTVTEDQTLTADTSGISDADGLGAFSYQWLRDGVAVSGATSSTYLLGDADVGAQMSVTVSYTDGGGTAESVTSAQTSAVGNVNDVPVGLPVLNGSAVENQTISVDVSAVSDADGFGAFNIEWMRDGVVFAVAPGPGSYVLGNGDVGTQISAAIVYVDGNGTTERLVTAPTAPVVNVNDAPLGVPVITGTAIENQTLTADTSGIIDPDGNGAYSYQWLRDGIVVAGATSSTYILDDSDVGAQMSVRVDYTDGHGTAETITSAQTAIVTNVNDAPVGLPVITGTFTEDQTLGVDTSGISDADGLGAFSYQWLRDGLAIGGANSSTYVLGDADVGAQISVSVSYTDGQGTAETVTSAQSAAVSNINDSPVGVPVVTGTTTEDQTLTADTSGISDDDGLGAFSYQWLRDGLAIVGANSSTYVLGDADVGTQISVSVSYTDGNGTAEGPLVSAQTAAIANVNDAPIGLPVINGTVTEDQTLNVDTSGISDVDGLGAFSYQWLRDGVDIVGATGAGYTLTDIDVGTQISVRVSYVDGQGAAENVVSAQTAAVTNVNDAPTGLPVLTGSAIEDQILSVNVDAIADADGLGPFTYEWMRDGVVFAVAGPSALLLSDAEVGTRISVAVTYVDGNGTTERIVSAQSAPVVNINDVPVGVPVISGAAVENQTLTADTSGIFDADGLGAFSYQWFRDGISIAGATGSTHLLDDADVGAQINVVVTYVDGHGTTETLSSAQTAAVTNVNDDPVITSNGGGINANISIDENNTSVTQVISSDVDGGVPAFSIVGGADSALFSIDPATGELSFNVAPDFEFPTDSGGINQYDVVVQVSDGNGGTDTQTIRVIVLDVDETVPITSTSGGSTVVDDSDDESSLDNLDPTAELDWTFVSSNVDTLSGDLSGQAEENQPKKENQQPTPEVELIPEPVIQPPEPIKIKPVDLKQVEKPSELEKVDHKLLIAFDRAQEEMQEESMFGLDTKSITLGTGTLLTAGYVSWILRSGALLSALLSTLPAWSSFDPIVVLTSRRSEDAEDDGKLSKVERIFERASRKAKQA